MTELFLKNRILMALIGKFTDFHHSVRSVFNNIHFLLFASFFTYCSELLFLTLCSQNFSFIAGNGKFKKAH